MSAYSRLSTPSPTRNSRSPAPQPAASSSSSSSSKSSSQSHTRSQSHIQPVQSRRQVSADAAQSGSETERESQHTLYTAASYASSSEDLPAVAPPSSTRPQSSLGVYRQRHISAPTSPEKAIARTASTSPTRSRTPATRSVRDVAGSSDHHGGERESVTRAALATVASSRRSPTNGSGRKRSALPREFRDRSGSLDHEVYLLLPTRINLVLTNTFIQLPVFASSSNNRRAPASPKAHISFADQSSSPPRLRQDRSSNQPMKRHQMRWQSEDHGSSFSKEEVVEDPNVGRRQSRRSGSIDNILGSGRSLISQGLKAAGILKKDDDVFTHPDQGPDRASRRKGSVDWSAEVHGDQTQERHRDRERSQSRVDALSNGRPTERRDASLVRDQGDPRTSNPVGGHSGALVSRSASGIRPATSMADYHYRDDDHGRQGDWARSGSALGRYPTLQQSQPQQSRNVSTPFSARRFSPAGGSNQHPTDHTRLMMDALSMFESQLSRVPPLGSTSTLTIPELFRSAQVITQASEKLNTQLRAATVKALEEQIDAEVGQDDEQGVDLVAVWRKIGGDYRENLRISDELIRTLTGFLLGMGKMLRETVAANGSVAGDNAHHGRTASLDHDGLRRDSPEVGGSGSGHSSERRSVEERSASRTESRRSWEPRGETPRRFSTRVDSILASIPRPSSALRNQDQDRDHEILSPMPTGYSQLAASSSARRLFAPREHREEQYNANIRSSAPDIGPSDSRQTFEHYEPSPTPASRQHQKPTLSLDRSRDLPPLDIQSPSPAIPPQNDKNVYDRRKLSNISMSTIRPSPVGFPALTHPNPTTAVTPHTVSNSPESAAFPLLRSNSGTSSRSYITFSKPSTISVSALTGLQQQHSQQIQRTTSSSSTATNSSQAQNGRGPSTPLSGSETERDVRRRTLGSKSVRASLDGAAYIDRRAEGGSGSQRMTVSNSSKKERRKTLTEIFSQG